MRKGAHVQCSVCGKTPIINSVNVTLIDRAMGTGKTKYQVTLYCEKCDRLYLIDDGLGP